MQRLDSCVCKAIFGHWSCHDKNRLGRHMHIKPMKIKTCVHSTLLGLENMTTYERVAGFTAGPVVDTYLELKMLCLFYFVLEREKTVIMSGLQCYMRNNSIFPLFILSFFIV